MDLTPTTEPAKEISFLKNFFINVGLFFGAIVICLVIAEGILRLTNFQDLSSFTVPCASPSTIPGVGVMLTPNCISRSDLSYSRGVEVSINSCGFRGPEEDCGRLKGQDPIVSSTPIFFLGDSYTNAANIDEPGTFVKVAEKDLISTGHNVAAFNFGIGSADVGQHVKLLKYIWSKYKLKPKIVVVQWLLNDLDPTPDFNPNSGRRFKMFLRDHIYLYRLIAYYKNMWFPNNRNLDIHTYSDMHDYRKKQFQDPANMEQAKKMICSFPQEIKNNSKIFFLNPVYFEMLGGWKDYDPEMQAIDSKINSIAESCGLTVIDPRAALEKFPIYDLVLQVKGDHHPNTLGNQIIGKTIADYLGSYLK